MTDEYQKATQKLVEYVTQIVDFGKEQMPDVVTQLLAYDAKIAWMLFFVCVIGALFTAFCLFLAVVSDAEGWQGVNFSILVVLILCSIGNYATLVKIETAPKLYVLDELNGRIKLECSK